MMNHEKKDKFAHLILKFLLYSNVAEFNLKRFGSTLESTLMIPYKLEKSV